MKKIIFILLCFMMLSASVYAITITVDENTAGVTDQGSYLVTNDTGVIGVTNVSENDSFAFYKLVDTYYNATTNEISYELSSWFSTLLANSGDPAASAITVQTVLNLTTGDITNGLVQSNSGIDYAASALVPLLMASNVSPYGTCTATSREIYDDINDAYEEINYCAIDDAEPGLYLILPTQTDRVYAVMVADVKLDGDSAGNWTLGETAVVAKASDPYVTSYIQNKGSSATLGFGSTFTYVATAAFPTYPTNATNKVARLSGNVDTSAFTVGVVTVKMGNTTLTMTPDDSILDENDNVVGASYVLTYNNDEIGIAEMYTNGDIVFEFDPDELTSNSVTVEAQLTVKNTATVGWSAAAECYDDDNDIATEDICGYIRNESDNVIEIAIEYANDPYGNGTTTSDTSNVYVYVGTLALYYPFNCEYAEEDYSQADCLSPDKLPLGAVFQVYSDSNLSNLVGTVTLNQDGAYYDYYDANNDTTYDIYLVGGYLPGMGNGTYYIRNSRAASGYKRSNQVIQVTVDDSDWDGDGMFSVNLGTPVESSNLPVTGGVGTYIFMGVGMIMIAGAMVYLIKNKKRSLEA